MNCILKTPRSNGRNYENRSFQSFRFLSMALLEDAGAIRHRILCPATLGRPSQIRLHGFLDPAELLFAIPAILSGLILFFLGGLLIGLLAQRLLRGVAGSWRRGLWVAIAVATPLAVLLSLVGGLLGPHMVVIGALVPYLLLVGIPLLIRQCVQRLRSPPRPEE